MLDKAKNIIAALIFILSSMIGLGFGFNCHAQASSIDYKLLKKTGVKILIRDYYIKNDDTFEFDLYKEDVSIKDYIWSLIWGKNFGFYLNGINPDDKNILCPYIGEDDKRSGSNIKDIGSGKHRVTLVLPPPLIDAVIENKCAVSPKPRKAPNVGKNKDKDSRNTLFPTIY